MNKTEANSLGQQLVAAIRQMQQEKIEDLPLPEDAAATIERLNTELTCYSEASEALRHENELLKSALEQASAQKPQGHPSAYGLVRSLHEAAEATSTSHRGQLFSEAATFIEGILAAIAQPAENENWVGPLALTSETAVDRPRKTPREAGVTTAYIRQYNGRLSDDDVESLLRKIMFRQNLRQHGMDWSQCNVSIIHAPPVVKVVWDNRQTKRKIAVDNIVFRIDGGIVHVDEEGQLAFL